MHQLTRDNYQDTFASLQAGIRACQAPCPDCGQPLAATPGVRTRLTEQGTPELICRPCFINEIAEQLLNAPRVA